MTLESGGWKRVLEAIEVNANESGLFYAKRESGATGPLSVDHTYQRGLDQRKVEDIRSTWKAVAAPAITLSCRRDASLWIVNGQHEIAAALLENESEMLAWVYTGLSVPDEAELRLILNNQRSDTALEKFHAGLTKEKAAPGVATAIVALLAEFGTDVNKSPNQYTGINCVGTVERLFRRGEGLILRRTLRVLKEAYGELRGDVVRASILEGMAWFLLVHHGEYSWKKLVEQLRKSNPDSLADSSRGYKRMMGGADWINHYRAILEQYNRAFRKDEYKLEMKTGRWTVTFRPRSPLRRTSPTGGGVPHEDHDRRESQPGDRVGLSHHGRSGEGDAPRFACRPRRGGRRDGRGGSPDRSRSVGWRHSL